MAAARGHGGRVTRRQVIIAACALMMAPVLARAACVATGRDDLGPFYVKDAPRQGDLCSASGEDGRLAISGRVLGAPDCKPLAGATIEVWQADAQGRYTQVSRERKDDPRCLLRATLTSDAGGRYAYRTIPAGEYPGRPRHIHYRVSAPGYRTLVTQLYFAPGDTADAARVATLAREAAASGKAAGYRAVFDITLDPAR